MEPAAELQDRRDPAAHVQMTFGAFQGAGDKLEQGALARTVAPQHADDFAAPNFQIYALQGHAAYVPAFTGDGLGESVNRILVNAIYLAQVARQDGDGCITHRASPNDGRVLSNTQQPSTNTPKLHTGKIIQAGWWNGAGRNRASCQHQVR